MTFYHKKVTEKVREKNTDAPLDNNNDVFVGPLRIWHLLNFSGARSVGGLSLTRPYWSGHC